MGHANLDDTAHRLRVHVIRSIYEAGSGHPGGSLGLAEIMSVLYFRTMRIDPDKPDWEDRDRLILSKGHAAPILYAVLAERGYFPIETLMTLRKTGSILQGHPDMRKTPGVDMTTGCLGEGLSAGIGMALAARLDCRDNYIFVIMSDGEIQEGQVWEAAMFAGHHRLDRLVAIIDENGCQCDDYMDDVLPVCPIADKWTPFGWRVIEVDGHDVAALEAAFAEAKKPCGSPTLVIAKTVKGKGVSFMENDPNWHGQIMTEEDCTRAMAELLEVRS